MRHIGEVLRLAAQGHSQREISSSVRISRTSVRNYLARAERAGLSWPLPDHVDASAIEAQLFRRTDEGVRSDRPEPDWLDVHREHKRGKHVTLQLLHLEYKQAHPDGWGYTQFCRHYRQWLGRQDVVMRLEYAAGERMFVDFAGDTVPVIDAESGRTWQAHVFVSVLGASGYLYAEATRGEDLASWLGAHVRALAFYGGSVRAVVLDNFPAAIAGPDALELRPTRGFLEYSQARGFLLDPARVRHPKDKACAPNCSLSTQSNAKA